MNRLSLVLWVLVMSLFAACKQPGKAPTLPDPVNTQADSLSRLPKTPAAGGEPVKQVLDHILDLAKAADCAGMAPLLAYQEGDGKDSWHRGLNYETLEEKIAAEKECAKLQVIVAGLESHTYQEFTTAHESEGEWLVWTVTLQYQDGAKEKQAFAFLKVGQDYLLGDIN